MVRIISNDVEDGVHFSDSSLSNDGDYLGIISERKVLKKGPWTTAEDAILVEYVKKHGEGNWNAVQKHSGVSRSGKSCRLRWVNHLRPNLKKGAFTSEEERLIVELHAKMGNKWARMAAHLPGRTDNELKNYWNTRKKKLQRAGMPLYPNELCQQTPSENQENVYSPGIFGGDEGCHDMLPCNGYERSGIMFDNSQIITFKPEFSELPANDSFKNGFGSTQCFSIGPQEVGMRKHTQDQDECTPYCNGTVANGAYPLDRAENDNSENSISQSYCPCFSYEHNQTKQLLPFGVNQDCHFMSNGIFSTSQPLAGVEKFELPSLQFQETNLCVWNLIPFDTAPELLDSFMQYPSSGPLTESCTSSQCDGLLESVLYEDMSVSKSENQTSERATSSSVSHEDAKYSSTLKAHSKDLKCYLDPTSPSGYSTASSFDQHSPADPIRSLMEERMPTCHLKSGFVYPNWMLKVKKEEISSQLDCTRPNGILGSCWFEQRGSSLKQQSYVSDAITALLSSDLSSDEHIPRN